MPPTHLAPWAKPLSGRYLSFREREDIALDLAKGIGIWAIARKLARSPSTISREVRRNAARAAVIWITGPVPHNGTPIVRPGGLGLVNWR
jgi:hypothetical protein